MSNRTVTLQGPTRERAKRTAADSTRRSEEAVHQNIVRCNALESEGSASSLEALLGCRYSQPCS